jgi:hypothetical protein
VEKLDLAVASNSFEFLTSTKFMDLRPWPMQVKIIAELFEDVCKNRKCTDLEFWSGILVDTEIDKIRERVTFLSHGKCPRCGLTRREMIRNNLYSGRDELILAAGINGGKTTTAASMIAPYLIHQAITIPLSSLGFAPDLVTLTGSFFGPTPSLSQDIFKHYFAGVALKTPWFQEFDRQIKSLDSPDYSVSFGIGSYRVKTPDCNLVITHSGHNSLARIRGRTNFFAVIDSPYESFSG